VNIKNNYNEKRGIFMIDDLFKRDSILKNIDIIHAKQTAFNILVEKKNMIHSIDHALRVHDNAMFIFMNVGDKNIKKMISLKLASYWHDTGKDDWSEKEEIPHNILSAQLFGRYAVKKGISDEIIEMTQSIISCHRNRGKDSFRSPLKDEEKALWDADKLDIVNAIRITEIIWLYIKGYKMGEFNLKDTMSFWMSITPEFASKFYFNISRNIFNKRYQRFKEIVQKVNADFKNSLSYDQ